MMPYINLTLACVMLIFLYIDVPQLWDSSKYKEKLGWVLLQSVLFTWNLTSAIKGFAEQ